MQALLKNSQYTLSLLTAVAQGIKRLQGVNGLPSVIDFAAAAKTQDETRLVAGAVNMLARYHESTQRIAAGDRAGSHHRADGHRRADGPRPRGLHRVDPAHRAPRAAGRPQGAPERLAWLSGQMSPRARKQSEGQGWTVFESFTIAAER